MMDNIIKIKQVRRKTISHEAQKLSNCWNSLQIHGFTASMNNFHTQQQSVRVISTMDSIENIAQHENQVKTQIFILTSSGWEINVPFI